jgi:peptidoglycan/LPS O-acetylase OafA/YrhL
MFLTPSAKLIGGSLIWNIFVAIAVGAVSYSLIELPSNYLSKRFRKKAEAQHAKVFSVSA